MIQTHLEGSSEEFDNTSFITLPYARYMVKLLYAITEWYREHKFLRVFVGHLKKRPVIMIMKIQYVIRSKAIYH